MCGIALFIDIQNKFDKKATIRRMCDLIAHRGPDHFNSFQNEQVALGHRRLSIIDLTESANQPFCKWDLIISFNGEIYNYLEVRTILVNAGYTFSTDSDTEVFLAAYHYWKTDCFRYLNGMWAVIICDVLSEKILLCRDRFGIKPLVYSHTPSFFAAGSEVKQLLGLDQRGHTLNEDTLKSFVISGALNQSNATFWADIHELPAAGLLVYDLKRHTFHSSTWYNLPRKQMEFKSYAEVLEVFRNMFLDALKLITRSDVKIGTLLSGGLDSSLILWGLQNLGLLNKVNCAFSSCFPGGPFDETNYIQTMLESVPIGSTKIFPLEHTESYHDIVCKLVYHHDQPILSPSHLSEYFVFQAVNREGYKVALGGQGVDEYLGGYKDFPYLYASDLYNSSHLAGFAKFAYQRSRMEGVSFQNLLRNYASFAKNLPKNQQHHLPSWVNRKIKSDFIPDSSRQAQTFDELIHQQITCTSFPYQLHSEDRNSMMMSVESRQPFLDYRLLELGVAIPSQYKMKNGWSKSILRDAFPELPVSIRQRKNKLGFPFPMDQFLRLNLPNVRSYLSKYPDVYERFLEPDITFLLRKGTDAEFLKINHSLIFRLYSLCVWQESQQAFVS
jgi:asparagine synthase (glutamine-hydrolysing)